ncbi:hypothetical protein [Aeromicrobium wangtongii]|uniref:hypothetical protein n=1 Tax=Aeromicrobium wangtongii TaxID=2969247 RepID=UPI0020179ACB|nr:hypothetical protein [Aeromicrobium wangtongii]MCL3817543.1 hypothetical protein [Aeromicrobium wangtongii]
MVTCQLAELRASVVASMPAAADSRAEQAAEAFVAICVGYSLQLAVRGDVDSAPIAAALLQTIGGAGASA